MTKGEYIKAFMALTSIYCNSGNKDYENICHRDCEKYNELEGVNIALDTYKFRKK